MRNLKPLSLFVFFLALACERTFTKTLCTENRCYRKRKYTVCRCGPAPFSPDILQAEAMKGLMLMQLSRALQALCDGTAFFSSLFFFFRGEWVDRKCAGRGSPLALGLECGNSVGDQWCNVPCWIWMQTSRFVQNKSVIVRKQLNLEW